MPNPVLARYNDGITRWNDGSRYNSAAPSTPPPLLLPPRNFTLNSTQTMEYWELTKQRAQQTLPVWQQLLPTLTIAAKGPADLDTLIDQFEPLVQERTAAQDVYDAAYRAAQSSLLKMKVLGTKVPQIIEGQLDGDAGLMKDVDDLYSNSPRTESSILKRARELYPVWLRADTALAALTPAQPPITRVVAGTAYTAALIKAELDGFTDLIRTMHEMQELLDGKRSALRQLNRETDQLNKRWYQVVKSQNDPGSPAYDALDGITTEPSTPAPDTVEINTLLQGGDGGLQVLVSYVSGGGDHATTKLVKWQIVGVDAGFDHSAPLDASGNALGPFTVGQEVKVITEVSNSSGTRTTAPRTIIIETPIG